MTQKLLFQRFVVFFLASMSFACLLGQMWNWWSMKTFACLILPPATAILIFLAVRAPKNAAMRMWIIEGAVGGVVAAIVYDLFRLPFVLGIVPGLKAMPLFGVFPRFGQLILDAPLTDYGAAVQFAGWAYHFSNGAALGIMFLAMLPKATPRALIIGATIWALAVEAMLLLSPYYAFFKLKFDSGTFLWITLSAHLIFGVSLGAWLSLRLKTKKHA